MVFRVYSNKQTIKQTNKQTNKQTRILSGNQFTTHFINFFVVETERFVGSSSNVILTRKTCGQSSSRAAESKRRAIGNIFRANLLYVPNIKMLRRLRSRSVHCLGTCEERTATQCQIPIFWANETLHFLGSLHCAVILFSQVPQKCTDLDLSLLYILTKGTYSKYARKNNFLALSICFPQPCSSSGRKFAASRARLKNYRRIVPFPQQKNRWNAL